MNSVVSANVGHPWTTYMRQQWWVMGSHHSRKAPKGAGLAPSQGGDGGVISLGSDSQAKLLPLPPSGRAHLFPVTTEMNLGKPSIQLSWWNQVAQVDWVEYLFFFSFPDICSSPWRWRGWCLWGAVVNISVREGGCMQGRKDLTTWLLPPSRWYHSVLIHCCSSECLKREKKTRCW